MEIVNLPLEVTQFLAVSALTKMRRCLSKQRHCTAIDFPLPIRRENAIQAKLRTVEGAALKTSIFARIQRILNKVSFKRRSGTIRGRKQFPFGVKILMLGSIQPSGKDIPTPDTIQKLSGLRENDYENCSIVCFVDATWSRSRIWSELRQ